jgi:hypothetical protein
MSLTLQKTPEEIQQEIETLSRICPSVRHYTLFGDDNHEAIKAQVEILKQLIGESPSDPHMVERKIGNYVKDYTYDAASEALNWACGERDPDELETPSKEWEALIER